ncbi:MAG: hypothetical protein R6X27_19585 [Candidatus Desulfacyla sp.]
MNTILVEIVAPMLSTLEIRSRGYGLVSDSLGLNGKYRSASVNEYPDDWKEATDYLTQWVAEISRLYRHRVRIAIIDAQSPLGFWKQLRHRVFRFPAFIVDREKTYIGWDYKELETIIDDRIHRRW